MAKQGYYSLPKFKKGQLVNSPSGEGVIEGMDYMGGANWYKVNGKYYAEQEITKV
jgi:hypothetical protein